MFNNEHCFTSSLQLSRKRFLAGPHRDSMVGSIPLLALGFTHCFLPAPYANPLLRHSVHTKLANRFHATQACVHVMSC